MAWKVGNEQHIVVGEDLILGGQDFNRLSPNMILALRNKGVFILAQVARLNIARGQRWVQATDLDLDITLSE